MWVSAQYVYQVGAKPPKLKTKAAETRNMTPVVLFVLEHFHPKDSEHAHKRLECVRNLESMYSEVYEATYSPVRAGAFARRCLALYEDLGRDARGATTIAARECWRTYPKMHLLVHCVEGESNPKEGWNYPDENCIGKAVKIAESLYTRTLHRSVVLKLRL